jgi:NAD(P)-dependent dehydrogenase (short-subunit alcohol dehydrogenase family)
MGLLSDKVALVFGAGNPQNMGAEIARRYAAEGAKVIAAGRKDALVAALAAEIAGEPLCCDITAESEVVRAAGWIRQHFGAIDILASAVGVQYHATLSEATECGIDMLVRAHIHAPIFLMKHITAYPAGWRDRHDLLGHGGAEQQSAGSWNICRHQGRHEQAAANRRDRVWRTRHPGECYRARPGRDSDGQACSAKNG